jgi:hypothetical protein
VAEAAHSAGTSIPEPAATSTSSVWLDLLAPAAPRLNGPSGQARLWWRLSGDASLAQVQVVPDWAGLGLGPGRNDAWQLVSAGAPVVLKAGGPAELVAQGPLPAARYRYAFVAAADASTRPEEPGPFVLHVEPIALAVPVSDGGTVDVVMELIALARSARSGGGHQLFVKDATFREEMDG